MFRLFRLGFLAFGRFLLRLWLGSLALRLLFFCKFFLDSLLRIHPFDERHGSRIAFAAAQPDNASVTAITFRRSLRDIVE